jgi:hypothetical protein
MIGVQKTMNRTSKTKAFQVGYTTVGWLRSISAWTGGTKGSEIEPCAEGVDEVAEVSAVKHPELISNGWRY